MTNIRPLAELYKALGKVLQNDLYLNLSEDEFVGLIMNHSHGHNTPKQIREIYYKLMIEAGRVNRDV